MVVYLNMDNFQPQEIFSSSDIDELYLPTTLFLYFLLEIFVISPVFIYDYNLQGITYITDHPIAFAILSIDHLYISCYKWKKQDMNDWPFLSLSTYDGDYFITFNI